MTRLEQIRTLNTILLKEMPQYREQAERFPADDASQRRLLRSLMNVRPPMPLDPAFLKVQNELLSAEREEKGVVDAMALPTVRSDPRLAVWQGDITRLKADAIVDADNSALLGCFVPCHGCIDNAIHSAAGLQLRDECAAIMRAQGLQSAGPVCAPHGGTHRGPVGDLEGPAGAGRLLPLLPGAGGGARSSQRGLLLHLHRRIPLPQPGGGGDRRENRPGISDGKCHHRKGDLQCF